MAQVVVRYFAAARAAAGVSEEPVTASTVQGCLATIGERHGPALVRVLDRASFLLDGTAVRGPDQALSDGITLDVLPPFAGG
jgi:molybdopterin synthase sulfur carrier subunit